ncbi:MAG TPA: PIN domain-containing protein [Verrucomicrobiae bacterium]|nr:PIN domain-containing protein [Verrucomicrobiae bacterium]
MRRYWDSSALLDAFFESRIESLVREPDQWTRPHTLAEMFSALTGGRLGGQFHPADASAIVRELTETMNFVELDAKEVQAALDSADKHGVRGGNVHDWMHATAAKKAGAIVLLTDNSTDFQNLADGFAVEAP